MFEVKLHVNVVQIFIALAVTAVFFPEISLNVVVFQVSN